MNYMDTKNNTKNPRNQELALRKEKINMLLAKLITKKGETIEINKIRDERVDITTYTSEIQIKT